MACPRPSSELRSIREASLLGKCVYFVGLEFALSMEQTAVIKETLRMAVTLPAGLPRVVPPSGAVISGVEIPGGVSVSCPYVFGYYLMPSADGREPECSFRFVFRRDFCAPARVSSRSVASA